jgi:hypothetical protein
MIKNILIAISILILLVLGCTKVAQKYNWDITQNQNNSLNSYGQKVIASLTESLNIDVYSPEMSILNNCESVLSLFSKYSTQVKVKFHQTILDPQQATKLNVVSEHSLMLEYKGVKHAIDINLNEFSQQKISTLIQQLINRANNWIVFLTGHNEADPLDNSEIGLSNFAKLFSDQGLHYTTLNLAETNLIPQNTAVLIVANPQLDFLPTEKNLLHQYLQSGGKLVWFTEPDSPITAFIAEEFGLKPSKGIAIDTISKQFGSPHPAVKIITAYSAHPINNDIQAATIFPWSAHLQILYQANEWQQEPFLQTNENTWTYTGPVSEDPNVLAKYKEFIGPLNLGIALSRPSTNNPEQRSLVIADSSFILNKYLPLYANAQLATNLITWVQHDNKVILYSAPPLRDLSYYPSKFDNFIYTYFFTIILPLLFIGFGFYQTRTKIG